ncbi:MULTISPECIES: FAD-dependent 5-carboxymethylaminomethyl-2-thiouridine(34) oxidoreductase MnmC [Francisella]|uniref:FAD-dependent oxidoreductase n=1 Tax=Francisella opportunistica TaxID=2016517 RepID=A0A345JQV0_9GAMM|nr:MULTISPECIES: FAD-dependent 5-carboxymethylaminomethyl-2-thiouridine(34) oxidoreductase MnmC [Francisella]APC91405.1 5-methylaminomethyl-2-thiouridine-forming enzyme mnmC [Francisella sp. MA067296]AXH29696.1 FAD-dependent oxidoreductase [Francisella opportunistica]AXH31346.1 FAD-dependent oxidoreductase [Francisella opportunistica]AXH32992.1 FAD-dependent oxidoreductase [Francisella opportunistica]
MSNKKIAIIGAGLAGCSLAYELSKSGSFDITIIDKSCEVADETSGNFAGILAPYLTSDNNFSDQFHTLGYSLLRDFINQYRNHIEICNQGVIQLLSDPKEQHRYQKIFTNRDIDSNVAKLLSATQVSQLINTTTSKSAVYYPNALALVPKSICQLWLKLANVKLNLQTELIAITTNQRGNWQLEFNNFNQVFDIVIFAGGYQLFKQITQLQKIPVYPSQGQLTVIQKSFDITKTIMDKGYIIPDYKQNLQVIGATFRNNSDTNADIREEDNDFNITQIKQMLSDNSTANINIVDSRVATRCVTSDHLPLVGKLVDYTKFEQKFYKPLSKGYPKVKIPKIEYQQGLYVSSGFGSKGLCSSLLAAKIITAQITNQKPPCCDKLLAALSLERFWIRGFKKGVKFL